MAYIRAFHVPQAAVPSAQAVPPSRQQMRFCRQNISDGRFQYARLALRFGAGESDSIRFAAFAISKTMSESYYQDHQGTKDKASNTTN